MNPDHFDWSKCIFCQKLLKGVKTTCPANTKRNDGGCGYSSLVKTIADFKDCGQLPHSLNLHMLDEGDGIEATCSRHSASWHKQCLRQTLHPTKVHRILKRSAESSDCSSIVETEPVSKIPRITRGLSGSVCIQFSAICFFCEKEGSDLRQVMTQKVDAKVRECATLLGDNMLLGKLVAGDMIATEAKYHPGCLLALYERASQVHKSVTDTNQFEFYPALHGESLALAEVISHIEDAKLSEKTPSVFKLSNLIRLYYEKLDNYGVSSSSKVHPTRFKERLLESCPYLTAVNHGREVLITFNENVGFALHQYQLNADLEALQLMHTIKMLRSAVFACSYRFNGSFETDSQAKSVPQSLISFINMLLEGPGCTGSLNQQAVLSIAQLIVFNSVKRPRVEPAAEDCTRYTVRRSLCQETPLPIYVGLMLHSATRKKKLVDKCHKLGLSISYDRVLQICNKSTNSVCMQYRNDNIVCPPCLNEGLFTVAAVDNIDHNLSSTTASASFHGTAVSLMQFPVEKVTVCSSVVSFESASDAASDIVLPENYTNVPPCFFPSTEPKIPQAEFNFDPSNDTTKAEYEWLNFAHESFVNENESNCMSWAAFHADQAHCKRIQPPISAILPLFKENANSVAMIRHSLTVVQSAVQKVNPSQVPVVTLDQPLYAIAKQIQWQWPSSYGEDKFVIMLGGLHIEMAALRMIGHWLDGSGWIQLLVKSGFTSAGTAESFLHASHVKRTRYAHTVTAVALYECMHKSYNLYREQLCEGDSENWVAKSFDEWRSDSNRSSIQFRYWNTVLDLELLVLSFVRSVRDSNFCQYVNSLQCLLPWFFACDHTNYARWLPIHIRDMLLLEKIHPDIYGKFVSGFFTVAKSQRKFSSIAFDQAHEQLNAVIKGDGGAVGLTSSDISLSRWTVAGPEIVRILKEFEGNNYFSSSGDVLHHEQSPAFQRRFAKDVHVVLQHLYEDNPFCVVSSSNLVVLCSRVLADPSVSQSVTLARETGVDQMNNFINERLKGSVPISVSLPRNKLHMFNFKVRDKKSDSRRLKQKELKTDCELFSRLYIACQSRDGDLDTFFRHENHPYPPSLSQNGNLRFGSKSDLLSCLSPMCPDNMPDVSSLSVDTYVLDGAVVVQMTSPGCCKTFSEYRDKVFIQYVLSYTKRARRVDVIFDVYCQSSLKAACREKRGTGLRTRVLPDTRIPTNWQQFLQVDENKHELFHFLANGKIDPIHGEILVTQGPQVICWSGSTNVSNICPCNHEEADTRILLHCLHASQCGSRKIAIRTVDTDVVVLAVSCFDEMSVDELWIHFGVGNKVRLLPVHAITRGLGPSKSTALPMFHALTGCDTVSCFYGKGKRSAWEAWNSYPEVTDVFINLYSISVSSEIDSSTVHKLERFIIIMYDRTSACFELDAARKFFFTKKSKLLEALPPTSAAFSQHVKRAVYQACLCWAHCLTKTIPIHDPGHWGWHSDGTRWSPFWTTLPEVSESSRELVKCFCKKGCTARCTCVKASLVCTALCQCDGKCSKM